MSTGIRFVDVLLPKLRDDSKTQTRRVVKPQPDQGGVIRQGQNEDDQPVFVVTESGCGGEWHHNIQPRYLTGDSVYLQEPFWSNVTGSSIRFYQPKGNGWVPVSGKGLSAAYARTWLRITNVSVERLQDISEDDCIAEGIEMQDVRPGKWLFHAPGVDADFYSAQTAFAALWDSLAKPDFRWKDNPWVWVYTFKRKTS